MTGSYSCMTLLSTLIFDTASLEQKTAWVEQAAKMGEDVVAREAEIAEFLSGDFNRVTYLGSGSFVGLAQELSSRSSSSPTVSLPLPGTPAWAIAMGRSPSWTTRLSCSCT